MRNPLGTLSVSDRSRCGAVLISIVKEILCRDLGKEVFYRELAQRSCHGYLLLLLFFIIIINMIMIIIVIIIIIFIFIFIFIFIIVIIIIIIINYYFKNKFIVRGAHTETLYRDLAQKSLTKILPTELL